MNRLLKKYYGAVNLFTIAVCSFLAVGTFNQLLGAALSADISLPAPKLAQFSSQPKPPAIQAGCALWNPFTGECNDPPPPCVDCGPTGPQGPTINSYEGQLVPEDYTCRESSWKCTLLGTFVGTDPKNSFAVVEKPDKKTVLFHWGQTVENGPVVGIFRHRFYFWNGNRVECLAFGDVDKTTEKTDSPSIDGAGEGFKGVSCSGETSCEIAGGVIDNAMSSLNEIASQAHIVPNYKNGQAAGFRIFSIKPNSLFSAINLKDGDVVQHINGEALDSPEKLLELYSKVKSAPKFRIDVERRGKPLSFEYTIRR